VPEKYKQKYIDILHKHQQATIWHLVGTLIWTLKFNVGFSSNGTTYYSKFFYQGNQAPSELVLTNMTSVWQQISSTKFI
jgi:hypothetical protein